MNLIDTHAHLDAFEGENAVNSMLSRSMNAGVTGIITCSARRNDWENYFQISQHHKNKVWWQFGIHPTEADETDICIIEREFERYMNSDTPPVSVGEIGLDFYRLPDEEPEVVKIKKLQADFFKVQLGLAKKADLPVCVHARSAIHECIQIINETGFDFSKTVFHCFSGDIDDIRIINDLGGRASFTGIITYKNADAMREAMLAQGLSKIMFETDCPYLAPVPLRGKKNEPSYLPFVSKKAAEIFGVSEAEMAAISTQNARDFFGL